MTVVEVLFSKLKGFVLRHINNLLQLFFIPESTARIPNPGKQLKNSPSAVDDREISNTALYRYLEKQTIESVLWRVLSQAFLKRAKSLIHTVLVTSHPGSNGPTEFFVQILKKTLLTKLFWTQQNCLADFLFSRRSALHSASQKTPAELLI